MPSDLLLVGTIIQILLILTAVCAALSIGLGVRTLTGALACLALSFVGMAIRGEPAALIAVAMGAMMELRLPAGRRHKGLLEWLLVAVGLCQVALALTLPFDLIFWVAQGLGVMVWTFAVVATFAPHWWQPRPGLLQSTDRGA